MAEMTTPKLSETEGPGILVDLVMYASGRVDLRNALAKIRRERPRIVMITWSYDARKSNENLPVIHVPEGTILVLNVWNGLPRFVIGSGHVVVYACSSWGNSIDVHGGSVHVTTFGERRKVTMSIEPTAGGAQPVISIDSPIERLYASRRFPERTAPPYAERIEPGRVEVDQYRNIPKSWLADPAPRA